MEREDRDHVRGFCKSLSYEELDRMEKNAYFRRMLYYKELTTFLKDYVDYLEETFGTGKPIDTTIRLQYQMQPNGFLVGKITTIPAMEVVVTPKEQPTEKRKLNFRERLKVLFKGELE